MVLAMVPEAPPAGPSHEFRRTKWLRAGRAGDTAAHICALVPAPLRRYIRPGKAHRADKDGRTTMDMTGKTVMITGASRGIGAETARVFARGG